MELIEHPEVLAAEIKELLDNPIVLEQVSQSLRRVQRTEG